MSKLGRFWPRPGHRGRPLNFIVRLHMNVQRKHLEKLNARDFERDPIWLVNLPKLEVATSVPPIDDLASDEPYVALTYYELADGTKFRGYCFVYDCTGHVLFGESGEPIPFSRAASCSKNETASIAEALARPAASIFPVRYRAAVKVFGRYPEGKIEIAI